MSFEIIPVPTPSLGDTSYLVAIEGSALLVDPQRDTGRFESLLDQHGLDLVAVLETHVHNDYVSGGLSIAERRSADVVMPAASGAAFRHRPAFHMEDLEIGPFTVRPIHTPGHTPEHVSYVIVRNGENVAVFTGGSLLVGAVGRCDLLGQERADSLTRLQYRSIHRLAALGDDVLLCPTHGSGSFCSATLATTTTSTIGAERSAPPLSLPDEDVFVTAQLSGLQPYPTYYARMGPINLLGPPPPPTHDVERIDPSALEELMVQGAEVVDARSKRAFAEGHISGTWGIEAGTDFTSWVGWLVAPDREMVLIVEQEPDIDEALVSLSRIGFDNVVGAMVGVQPWAESGRPLRNHETIGAKELVSLEGDPQILDVRAPWEWDDGHLARSRHCYLPDLVTATPKWIDRDRPIYIGCATGHRASIAAGVLQDRGYTPVVVLGASILGAVMLEAQAAAS